jgi:hypothetical protein
MFGQGPMLWKYFRQKKWRFGFQVCTAIYAGKMTITLVSMKIANCLQKIGENCNKW